MTQLCSVVVRTTNLIAVYNYNCTLHHAGGITQVASLKLWYSLPTH